AVADKWQHLMQHDGVGGAVGQRYVIEIAVADLGMGEPCPLELHARISEHVVIEVEDEEAAGAGAEQLEETPRTGAEIDEKREGPLPQRLVHGALDLLVGDMQVADSVPLGGMRL